MLPGHRTRTKAKQGGQHLIKEHHLAMRLDSSCIREAMSSRGGSRDPTGQEEDQEILDDMVLIAKILQVVSDEATRASDSARRTMIRERLGQRKVGSQPRTRKQRIQEGQLQLRQRRRNRRPTHRRGRRWTSPTLTGPQGGLDHAATSCRRSSRATGSRGSSFEIKLQFEVSSKEERRRCNTTKQSV